MKFLEKIGIGKKKKEEDEVAVAKPSRGARLMNVMKTLNQPLGGMSGGRMEGFTPRRTPVEKQLGIPEFVNPLDRKRDFTSTPKPIPQTKQESKKSRPRPGVPYKGGNPW